MSDRVDKINGASRDKQGMFSRNMELTDKQLEAIRLLVWDDEVDASNPKCADKLGIARSTLWKWHQDEVFADELMKERHKKVNMLGSVALRQLEKLMMQGADKRTQLAALKLILNDVNIGNRNEQLSENTSNNFVIKITTDNDVEIEE